MEFAIDFAEQGFPSPSSGGPLSYAATVAAARESVVVESHPTLWSRFISASFVPKPPSHRRVVRQPSHQYSPQSGNHNDFVEGDDRRSDRSSEWFVSQGGLVLEPRSDVATTTPPSPDEDVHIANEAVTTVPAYLFALRLPTMTSLSNSLKPCDVRSTTAAAATMAHPAKTFSGTSGAVEEEGAQRGLTPIIEQLHWRILFVAVVIPPEHSSAAHGGSVQQTVKQFQQCRQFRLLPSSSSASSSEEGNAIDVLDRVLDPSSSGADVSNMLLQVSGVTVDDLFPPPSPPPEKGKGGEELPAFDAAMNAEGGDDDAPPPYRQRFVLENEEEEEERRRKGSGKRLSAIRRVIGAFANRLILAEVRSSSNEDDDRSIVTVQ